MELALSVVLALALAVMTALVVYLVRHQAPRSVARAWARLLPQGIERASWTPLSYVAAENLAAEQRSPVARRPHHR